VSTEARFSTLERALAELAAAQAQTTANVDRVSANVERLSEEMRVFQGEMRVFQSEMRAFQGEMRVFQGEMRTFQGEMRAARKEADKRWGELANSMGTLAEDIVAPGIPEVFGTLFGVERVARVVRANLSHKDDPGRSQEFDVVAWGGGYFLVNETKTRARPEDIPPLVALLPEVRGFFPQAEGLKVVGSLASLYVEPSLVRAAERQGLFVFGLSSGLPEVMNTPGFKPSAY
jgi:hypothetical protein